MIRVRLARNLRRSLLQGNPWVYRSAIEPIKRAEGPGLCEVKDSKNAFVGWGIYSSNSPIAVRMLSLDKKPPKDSLYLHRLQEAFFIRNSVSNADTNCFRAVNGEGDLLPGFVCDVYGRVAVFQFDGLEMYEFWKDFEFQNWVLENTDCETVYFKPRHDMNLPPKCWGNELSEDLVLVEENGVKFYVDVVNGQKTGFFLDQRDNRNYLSELCKDQSVLNLFSYSGGFSIYAGVAGANKVTSVDVADGALELCKKNWEANNLNSADQETIAADIFEMDFKQLGQFDVVVCDPPSLAKSEKAKDGAVKMYVDVFSRAAKIVRPGGHLVLSSCSSHIHFSDFEEIYSQALSGARRTGRVLNISGQGMDHPFPHALPQLRYLKFAHLKLD